MCDFWISYVFSWFADGSLSHGMYYIHIIICIYIYTYMYHKKIHQMQVNRQKTWMVWVWQRPKKMPLKKKSPSSHLLCSRFDGVARNLGHFTGHVLGPSGWHTGRPGVGCTPNSVTWEITITHTYPLYTTILGFFGGFPIRGYIGLVVVHPTIPWPQINLYWERANFHYIAGS